MERVLAVDMVNGTPTLAAALAVANSPSLCKIPCAPTGAMIMGEGSLTPKRVVWEVRQSALLLVSEESSAYIKIAMGRIT